MMPQGPRALERPVPGPGVPGSRRHPGHPGSLPALDLLPHIAAREAVRREDLLLRLETLPDDVRVILLSAPAGYGKTTAVRQWVESGRHRFAWLPVAVVHNDPSHLALDIALTLNGDLPTEAVLSDQVGWVQDPPSEALGPRLGAAVRALGGEPVVLVLDDVHNLRARHSLDLVLALAEHLPVPSRIVVLADQVLRWRVGRLLAHGRCLEFGPGDLALTGSEAVALLEKAGLHLPTNAVDELVRRTEGWPLGLHLAARALSDADDPVAAVWTFTGTSEHVADYFRDEVLSREPMETVRFLMRTAVLGTISGSLCDAALGSTDSVRRLAEAHALGLFLNAEDDRGEWYRYQRLFAEMLRSELHRREPGIHLRILRRAAQWYEDQGRPIEAIEHAIAAGGTLTAGRLIVAHTQFLNSRGEIDRVRALLEKLDEDTPELYPPLAVMAAWVWALTGDAPRAQRSLAIAESASFDGPLADGSVSLESAVLRARAALAPDGAERMLADAERAVAFEPPGSLWHTMAAVQLGAAHMVNGHGDDADRWFEQAARFGRAEQRPGAMTALAEQALLAAERRDWSMARLCLRECVDDREAGNLQGYMPALLTYLAGAFVALHEGDTPRALAETRAALALYESPSPVAFPWLAVQSAVALGNLFLGFGDVPAAERKLTEARRHLTMLPTARALHAWVERLATATENALTQSMSEDATSLTTAELRVLRMLPTHLSLAQIADELVVSRNTVKSQVAAIYQKLRASSRADAVRRAEHDGLLGPGLLENPPRPTQR
jgi:LuxR family maltose regulon positive regulatory protein